jgi:uncharacterized membrane protein
MERRRQYPALAVQLTGLIIVAILLRSWRLGTWSLDGDEIHTLQDSLVLRPENPRPLLYLLNHYLVRPFAPLDEFSLRILPAIFGVLAIPTIHAVVRRLAGARAALFAALLVSISSVHIYYSQLARYWSLVFLLCAVYPFVLYSGIRRRDWRTIALGAVTGVLAALAHPSSMLLFGGLLVFLLFDLGYENIRRLWSEPQIRRFVLAVGALGAAAAAASIQILHEWIIAHPGARHAGNLTHGGGSYGVKQILYLLSFVNELTVPLTLFGALGVWMLWQGRDRSLGMLLTCLFLFPVCALLLISSRAPVSTVYLMPTTPLVFIGASVLLDQLMDLDLGVKPRWLPAAIMVLVITAANAPSLISQYRDGRRHDFAAAARWLKAQRRPADVVYSDHPAILAYYLSGPRPLRLGADTTQLAAAFLQQRQSGRGGAIWIVAPALRHAVRSNARLLSLNEWMFGNCQLRHSTGVARLDFRQDQLQIYRCGPVAIDQLVTSPRQRP